jgi:hypothetical protein
MMAWQFCGLMSAIYLAPRRPGAVNICAGVVFCFLSIISAVLGK